LRFIGGGGVGAGGITCGAGGPSPRQHFDVVIPRVIFRPGGGGGVRGGARLVGVWGVGWGL
ncbi:ATP-binding protein, partial [Micromonospora arborensis]